MSRRYSATDRVRVRLLMERDFAAFVGPVRQEFFDDLATLIGASVYDLQDIVITEGCVRVNLTVTRAQADLLRQWLSAREARWPDMPPEVESLLTFISKHSIIDLATSAGQQLPSPPDDSKAIVFIHGWTSSDGPFRALAEETGKTLGVRTVLYSYPTSGWDHSPNLYSVAVHLENWLIDNADSESYALVTHSMGGLIARKMITRQRFRQQRRLDLRIRHLSLIASPNNGAALARLGKYVPGLASDQVQDLKPDSSFLLELTADWTVWQQQNSAGCTVRCVYGTKDAVVAPGNAASLDPEAVPLLGRTHTDILASPELPRLLERFINESTLVITYSPPSPLPTPAA